MLEEIRISQDGMAVEVLGNIVAELGKRGTFGGFGEEKMESLLEIMRNKLEYALKDSQKATGQLEECSDSIVIQIVLNGSTFKYHFEGDRFHMLPQSYKFYHGLGLNNFLQVLLICNQIDQVLPFIYTNWDDNVSHLVKLRRVIEGMKYLTRLVKRAMEAVGI